MSHPEYDASRFREDQGAGGAGGKTRRRQALEPPPIGEEVGRQKPNFRTLAKFISEFRPISYAVAGLMREGSLYTFTGRTGEGKTSFLTILALAVATGEGHRLIGRKVKKGRVAYATAENPDDLRMRLMIACFVFNIGPECLDSVVVSDNRVRPEEIIDWVKATGEAFSLIIIDTWQAFFDGRDPNNNAEAVGFTRRFRPLAATAGLPVVIIAAHPPKQASDDNLLPYGGGATLNEVDGNFTISLDENGLYVFHWLGKIRGLPFDPLHFRIDKLDSPDIVTVEGERVKMPLMFPVAEEDVEARSESLARRELALLKAMAVEPDGSERRWSTVLGVSRRVVQSGLKALRRDKLATKKLNRWRLTKEGERLAKEGAPASEKEPEDATENSPKKGRSSADPAKRKTGRSRTRSKVTPAIPGDPNVH